MKTNLIKFNSIYFDKIEINIDKYSIINIIIRYKKTCFDVHQQFLFIVVYRLLFIIIVCLQ